MKWLLWRECRLNMLILGVAAFLLVVPYIIAVTTVLVVGAENLVTRISPWAAALAAAAGYSLVLNQLTFALLGGNAFAGERADGSAEFMAYQPVSRARRLACKLLLVLIVAVVIWGMNALVGVALFPHLGHRGVEHAIVFCGYVAVTGLTFFCVSWFVSAIQSTPTYAVAVGLIVPFLLVATLQFIAWVTRWDLLNQYGVAIGYVIGCLICACVSFLLGTQYFLRRIEP
jgi:ABC-type transport system involved in multi-copper enzyme maturation permease subunit